MACLHSRLQLNIINDTNRWGNSFIAALQLHLPILDKPPTIRLLMNVSADEVVWKIQRSPPQILSTRVGASQPSHHCAALPDDTLLPGLAYSLCKAHRPESRLGNRPVAWGLEGIMCNLLGAPTHACLWVCIAGKEQSQALGWVAWLGVSR